MVGVDCLLVLVGLGCFEVLFVCCDGFGFNVVWVLWFVWCGVAVVCGELVLSCLSGCGVGRVVLLYSFGYFCMLVAYGLLGCSCVLVGSWPLFRSVVGFVVVGILGGLGFWLVWCWDGVFYC